MAPAAFFNEGRCNSCSASVPLRTCLHEWTRPHGPLRLRSPRLQERSDLTTGCDYSFARPSMAALAPYAFVGRYAGGTPAKELSLAEAQELTKAGKRILANFESTGRGGSYAQGQADAHYANSHFRSCGAEGDFVIFFSIDYDAPVDSQDDYFRGIVSVIGQGRTDVYASRAIILHLRSIHLIRTGQSGWRSMSTGWAGGAGSPSEFSVIQDGTALNGNVDVD